MNSLLKSISQVKLLYRLDQLSLPGDLNNEFGCLPVYIHSIGQDERNEVQHDFTGHMMPLAYVSYDADSVFTGTIEFLRPR